MTDQEKPQGEPEQPPAQPASTSEAMTAEEFAARLAAARQEAREKGLEQPKLKLRVWNVVKTRPGKMAEDLNRLEQEGWTLVNILPNGIESQVIVLARIVELEVPAEPVEDVKNETDPETVAPIVDESEEARRKWAAETGGDQGEAGASTQEVEPEEPKRIITDV